MSKGRLPAGLVHGHGNRRLRRAMTSTNMLTRIHLSRLLLGLWLLCGLLSTPALAEQQPPVSDPTGTQVAPVIVDGNKLFRVRGLPAYPASRRASEIRQRIIGLAGDASFKVDLLTISNEEPDRSIVMAGDQELLSVFDEDAALENIRRQLLAEVYRNNIADAITQFRADRSTGRLVNNSLMALAATALFVLLLWATRRLFRWLVDSN